MISILWLKRWQSPKKCSEMAPNQKSLKIVTEVTVLKIMINCQNGLLKIRKNITSKKNLSQRKSSLNKKKD